MAEIPTERLALFVEMLATIPFFPPEAGARAMIVDEMRSMCHTEEQAVWLVRRMVRLYDRWPGPREMRNVFCSKFIARDGFNSTAVSEYYPEGIPSEREAVGQPVLALPAGSVSVDAELNAAITALAKQKSL